MNSSNIINTNTGNPNNNNNNTMNNVFYCVCAKTFSTPIELFDHFNSENMCKLYYNILLGKYGDNVQVQAYLRSKIHSITSNPNNMNIDNNNVNTNPPADEKTIVRTTTTTLSSNETNPPSKGAVTIDKGIVKDDDRSTVNEGSSNNTTTEEEGNVSDASSSTVSIRRSSRVREHQMKEISRTRRKSLRSGGVDTLPSRLRICDADEGNDESSEGNYESSEDNSPPPKSSKGTKRSTKSSAVSKGRLSKRQKVEEEAVIENEESSNGEEEGGSSDHYDEDEEKSENEEDIENSNDDEVGEDITGTSTAQHSTKTIRPYMSMKLLTEAIVRSSALPWATGINQIKPEYRYREIENIKRYSDLSPSEEP